jgi:NAD(P)-dependent dehydrogenase (short-subunit alcohol dehydrogenase family)
MLKIAVIDAQGGGFGKAIVEGLSVLGDKVDILALGTNVYATMAMRNAGAHRYATGENAVSNISNTQFHGIDLTKMIFLSKEKNCKKTFAVFYTVSS